MNGLTLPTIEINGVTMPLVPNSAIYIKGDGRTEVKAATVGGGTAIPVFLADKTEAVGCVKFKIYPTAEAINVVEDARESGNDNVVLLTDQGFSKTSNNMKVGTEDIEYELGVDAEIEVICKGSQVK